MSMSVYDIDHVEPATGSFPFQRRLSLDPLVAWWTKRQEEAGAEGMDWSRQVPSLRPSQGSFLEGVDPLLWAIFPMIEPERGGLVATTPFGRRVIHATRLFRELQLIDAEHDLSLLDIDAKRGHDHAARTAVHAYSFILSRVYGVTIPANASTFVKVVDPATGLRRYLFVELDTRFQEVVCDGPPLDVAEGEIARLREHPQDLDLWRSVLPPAHFVITGFSILRATEVTAGQAFSRIRKDLIDADALSEPERFHGLQARVGDLFSIPDLRLGLLDVQDDREDPSGPVSFGHSLLMSDGKLPGCPDRFRSCYAEVLSKGTPVLVRDLERSGRNTGYEAALRAQGLRSLYLMPLQDKERTIGILEIASSTPDAFDESMETQLAELGDLFAIALARNLDARRDRIKAVIMQRYTSAHPVIEWRFRRAALRFLEGGDAMAIEEAERELLRLPQVIPLYAQADIRGSSDLRNEAVRSDLRQQLEMAREAVGAIDHVDSKPSLGELRYRIGVRIDDLDRLDVQSVEFDVVRMLRAEVEPILRRWVQRDEPAGQASLRYLEALDPRLGIVYRQRKRLDDSVLLLTEFMSCWLDEEDSRAQHLAPHYLERYLTDGIEYTIYAGASVTEDGVFDEIRLRDLRIWQLESLVELSRRLATFVENLPLPLDVALLVLVQSQAIDVKFRRDEKRFDVDGAYNARFEILKKRIDKAQVRGTGDRLTQPGHIAVVYSLASERADYIRYFEYLASKGLLGPGTEDLDLEPMPGAAGLKALRVAVRSSGTS